MKTICFLTIKGGTGKTTSVLTVGTMMAKAGKKVLLVDLDPQQNLSSMYVDDDVNNVDDFCAIYNGEYKDNGKTMDALLLDKKYDTKEYIHNTKIENLDIIPSTAYLAQVEVILKTSFDDVQQWILKNRLAQVQDEYDYCLLDCGPSLGILNANALGAANEVYIPTRTDGGSFTGVALMLSTIREQTYNPTLKVGGCFITEYVRQTNNAKDTYMDYMEAFARCGLEDMLLPLVIRQSSIVPNLSQKRELLIEADPSMRNNVTKDYAVLTKLIMSEDKKGFIEENKLHNKMNKLLGFEENA